MVLLSSKRMKTPIIFSANSEKEFYDTLLEDLTLSIKEVLQSKPHCLIGLAGGNTPQKLYSLLSNEQLPWEKIIFILTDERYVPSDNAESNLKMIRSALFNHIPIPPENIFTFDTSLPPDSAAMEMSRKLRKLNRNPLIDILILGAGVDGHIASLFDDDIAKDSKDFAAVATAPDYATEQRLTLTLKSLLNSGKTFILLKGEKKRQIFEKIKNGTGIRFALDRILEKDFLKVYFCG